jgi:L-seryl-tRNA(Ser) seleniumtransferase
MTDPDTSSRLRELPSVDRLATAVARAELDARRAELLGGAQDSVDLVARARGRLAPRLRRVLNATGVVVHTNLGRGSLAGSARAAVTRVAEGYSNLETDLERGGRGSRHDHIDALLSELTRPRPGSLSTTAPPRSCSPSPQLGGGRETIVSRGQLIEIGGGFRIPEVLAQAGTRLVEVGTTNRTRLEDYRAAIGEHTGAILRAHPSNFRTLGFVEEVATEALCELDVPVIDDVGSGVLVVVPEDVVDPGLLGGWLVSKPPVPRRTPDEVAR